MKTNQTFKLLGIVLTLAMLATLLCAVALPASAESTSTGSITPVYTRDNGFWGEGGGNASESLVIELYEGDTKIASASLNNVGGIIDGDVYVTWSIPFAGSTDEYWTVEWAAGYPKYDMNPTKGVMVIDGTPVAESKVQFNAPDDLNKIVALAEGFTGGVKAYTSLADAMGKFNGRKVNVLRDVTESIEGFYGCTLTTNVEGGVTINNTYDKWVDMNDLDIGKGVTLQAADVFYDTDGVNTIEGTLAVSGTFYHGYDAKTTVQNGGKVIVGGTTILRYNENADSGLYIYGDGDDSTVEFDCDYYIGAYSGTFYAKDATVECGYFLLKNSYDDSSYADIDMTLDNSTLTVAGTSDGQDSFIIDDQASLTLKNGSSVADVRDFSVLEGANLTLNVDATSSIKATNMNIADDVPMDKVENGDGTTSIAPHTHVFTSENGTCTCGVIGGYCGGEGDGTNLTWTLIDGTLTIYGEGAMKNYERDYSIWFGNQSIKKVVITDGVTTVGDHAFGWCMYLTSVELPETLISIGKSSFYLCSKLESITFPASLESIGDYAFDFCEKLKTVNVSHCSWTWWEKPYEFGDDVTVNVPAHDWTYEMTNYRGGILSCGNCNKEIDVGIQGSASQIYGLKWNTVDYSKITVTFDGETMDGTWKFVNEEGDRPLIAGFQPAIFTPENDLYDPFQVDLYFYFLYAYPSIQIGTNQSVYLPGQTL
ncbi:MAG: leucine-rich repeat domain-containing protein, partial [Clostridia bacterium]|nr:leucine-rich repeat domain-containing protein [Clostridia bacterium]